MKVEITSDDEFRRIGNRIFKERRKFSLEKSGVCGRRTINDKQSE